MRINPQIYRNLAIFLLSLGGLVRIVEYLRNRSVFIDEANLARNIAEKDVAGFFERLDYFQYAPPLFCSLQKLLWESIGYSEYSLRLAPMLAGVASLLLLYRLSVKLLPANLALLFPAWLLAFSPLCIRYATEGKQYSIDLFCCLLLLHLATSKSFRSASRRGLIGWTLIGSIVIWFSMPSIFVLAGIGGWMLPGKRSISWQSFLPISMWLISFCAYYFLILQADASRPSLLVFHESAFPNLYNFWSLLLGFFQPAIGYTTASLVLGIPALGTGIYALWKQDRHWFWLLLIPLLSTFLAACLHKYPLTDRLLLFLKPLTILLVAYGFATWLQWNHNRFAPVVLSGMILIGSLSVGYRHLWTPIQIEEVKPLLAEIENAPDPDLPLTITHESGPAFHFYASLVKPTHQFVAKEPIQLSWQETTDLRLFCHDRAGSEGDFRVLYSHLVGAGNMQELYRKQTLLDSFSIVHTIHEAPGALLETRVWKDNE